MRTHHNKFRSISSYALLLGILSISACQSGHELHFFKYGNNYYRLKIKEMSFASKSRYMSGFYDDKAVDRYFSEFSQPKESAAKKNDEVTFINPITGTDKTCNCPADSNRKLVMILSTNSDAVSEQIGAFAENDQILESIARLSNKDKIEGTKKFESQMREGNTRNQSLITLGDQYIQSLSADTKSDVIRSTMVGYLQNLQVISSSSQNKTNIEILLSSFQK